MIMGIGRFSLHCKQSNFVEPNLVSYENKRITKAIQIMYVVSSPFSAIQDIALIYVIDICTRDASFESSRHQICVFIHTFLSLSAFFFMR